MFRQHLLPLPSRLYAIIRTYLILGFISFGGPGVHVVLLRQRFVHQLRWISDKTFLDLFALANALPGPGSTQIAFSIAVVTHGVLPGILAFFFWCMPGAVGMTLLGAGVQRIPSDLHPAVLALLTGLNAAAVGLIALAAEQLAGASVTDRVTLAIVWLSTAFGVCYHAPWMYPTLIAAGGLTTVLWDYRRVWLLRPIRRALGRGRGGAASEERREETEVELEERDPEAASTTPAPALQSPPQPDPERATITPPGTIPSPPPTPPRRHSSLPSTATAETGIAERTAPSSQTAINTAPADPAAPPTESADPLRVVPFAASYALIAAFVLLLAIPLAVRGGLSSAGKDVPRPLSFFANMMLAGTIIFGGGPVVVPLLRDYVVNPGWVSNRDFLLIFAILQAFPGPNFNFSMALGFLALSASPTYPSGSTGTSLAGSLLGFTGIFAPGILLMLAFLPIYSKFRLLPIVRAAIRGLNAAATGLVFVAVWQLFLVGYVYRSATGEQGTVGTVSGPLTADPWWVVVASGAFLACRNYKAPPWAGIMGGGVAGVAWYGVTR